MGPHRTVIFSAGLNINLHDEQGDNSLSYYTPGTDIRPETKDGKFFRCLSGPILRMVPLLSDLTEYLGSTELFFFFPQDCRFAERNLEFIHLFLGDWRYSYTEGIG